MALRKRHTHLGLHLHLSNPIPITLLVHPLIRALDNRLPEGGLVLVTKEQRAVAERGRKVSDILPQYDDPTHKDLQTAAHRCHGLSLKDLVGISSILTIQNPSTLRTWRDDRGIGVQTLMPELALLHISHE